MAAIVNLYNRLRKRKLSKARLNYSPAQLLYSPSLSSLPASASSSTRPTLLASVLSCGLPLCFQDSLGSAAGLFSYIALFILLLLRRIFHDHSLPRLRDPLRERGMEINWESSSSATGNDRPVVVRMKRKSSQSPLDAFWLEISERPSKRPYLNFDNLSISDSSRRIGEVVVRRLLVRHVESTNTSGAKPELLQSFAQLKLTESSEGNDDRSDVNKKEDTSEELLIKAREIRQRIAGNTRFKQIWSSRKENQLAMDGLYPDQSCQFYDVMRLDDLQEPGKMQAQESMSLEDQRILSSYLPLLREFIPSAASEIERDISACTVNRGAVDDYMYDFYAVNDCMDECDKNPPGEFPLVQVEDDDDLYDEPDEAEVESEDSNAEDNPKNDYPEEASEDELLSEDLARDGGGEGEGGESGDVTCSESDDLDIDIALDEDFA